MNETMYVEIELPVHLWEVLEAMADKRGISVDELANELISQELDKYELSDKDTG